MSASSTIERINIANDPNSRRNCYYRLFNIYNDLNINDLLQSFTKIYNDVFIREKPLIIQRYYLSEVKIVELYETPNFSQ